MDRGGAAVIDEITRLRAAEAGLEPAESRPDPPLVSMPLRIDWEKACGEAVAGGEDYPAPHVDSRNDIEAAWPSSLMGMRAFAAGYGWRSVSQYSRGCMPHATTGRPGPVKDWYALRLAAPGGARRAWMVHDGMKWTTVGIWGDGVPALTGELGVTAIQQWIVGPEDPLAFRDGLSRIKAQTVVRKREAAARLAKAKREAGLGAGSGHAL